MDTHLPLHGITRPHFNHLYLGSDLHGELKYQDHHGAGILAADFSVDDHDFIIVEVFKNCILPIGVEK